MARLIDAGALEADCDIFNAWDAQIVKAWLADQPTVDAVEVVRCKDCVHFQEGYCNYFSFYGYAPNVKDEDFCSNGLERERERAGGTIHE